MRNARQNKEHGQPQGHGLDSYVRHSVAPKLFPPPGPPQRPQIEADASKLLCSSSEHPAHTVDESAQLPLTGTSSADTQRRRVIKRKVLRYFRASDISAFTAFTAINLQNSLCNRNRTENFRYWMGIKIIRIQKNILVLI